MSKIAASPARKIVFQRVLHFGPALLGLLIVLTACQSTPVRTTGYLSNYDNLNVAKISALGMTSAPKKVAHAETVEHVYVQPAVLRLEDGTHFSKEELASVQNEVDRQVCFEVSKYFTVDAQPSDKAGIVRTAIVTLLPTGRAGSVVSAAVHFVLPIPVVDFRTPMTTGSIGIETELLGPDGKQMTSLVWSRRAEVVGRIAPSFSRVGDALQLTKPMGNAVGKAFEGYGHAKAAPDPDPCVRFGSRLNVGGKVAGALAGAGTGLYVPEASGAGAGAIGAK